MTAKEQQIKETADQLITKGSMDVIDHAFTPGYVAHAEGKDHKGHAFLKQFQKRLSSAIPDMKVVDITFFLEKGDTIAWRRTLTGTHQANMMGIPASNRKIKWNEMLMSRFEGDKIAEEWIVSELKGELLLKARR